MFFEAGEVGGVSDFAEVIPLRPNQEPERYLTREELADRQNVSVRTVDRWVREGIPSETWGMRIRRFRVPDVERWLRKRGA